MASGEPDAWTLSGVGARPLGMGGAFVGLADDIEAIYFNPAGLSNIDQWTASAMIQPASMQTSRGFLGVGKNWASGKHPAAAAFGWHRLSSADIEITNTDEQVLGEDDLSNDLFMAGAGLKLLDHWSFGGTLKYHRFAFNGFSEAGFGVDAGAQGIYGDYRFGAVMTDIGGTMLKGDSIAPGGGDVRDKIPARLRLGVAATLDPRDWPVDINLDLDGMFKLQGGKESRVHMGGEVLMFQKRGAVRAGFEQYSGPTFGLGGRFGFFQLDYAYLLSLNLTDEHRISTTFRF